MNLSKFVRGVISGGLIGDCYGYVYEDRATVDVSVPVKLLNDTLTDLDKSVLIYTDDTQMGLATLRSLRCNNGLNASHLAREYAQDFFKDGAHRYYGGTVPSIFRNNELNNYSDPYSYPATLFKGSGSFGNGGAMRVSPLAVYGLQMSNDDFDKLVIDVTRLTHTNPLAIFGALLQAYAVQNLWSVVSKPPTSEPFNASQFLDQLLDRLRAVRYDYVDWSDPKWNDAKSRYADKFKIIKDLLSASKEPSTKEVAKLLGNDLKAINSVPVSLFAFLRSLKPIDGIPFSSIPLRCLIYTISLGGDTDSNATMACSLAGGFVGLDAPPTPLDSPIPDKILARCERLPIVNEMIEWLSSKLTN